MSNEIHDRSPNESVGQFFYWMYKKALFETRVISGRINGVVYKITPNLPSLVTAFDKYLENNVK